MTIIYIAGLPRSGTTFLQGQLSQYKNVVALGEVKQTVDAIRNVTANIPKWKLKFNARKETQWNPKTYPILMERIEKDSFWEPIKKEIQAAANTQSAIEMVFKKAIEKYPDHVIIDSSKNLTQLQNIVNIKSEFNLKVLLCLRDYRGWLYSIEKNRKRVNVPVRNRLIEIYKWLYLNKKFINFLKKNFKDRYQAISYDKLVFSRDEIMKRIISFCNLSEMLEDENEYKFHEILGSPSFKKNVNKKIFYDAEWFSYKGSLLEPPVSSFNKKIYLKYT